MQPVICRNDTNIVIGDSVTVGANLGEANLYSWQPTTGLSCTNCPNPKASPTITTTYTVTKTQCKAVTSDMITITVSPTGLTEGQQLIKSLFIYPNPTKGILSISTSPGVAHAIKIKLTDVLGKEIINDTLKPQLDISSLKDGIYFLSFYNSDQLLITKKVIKQ